jgi:hypothetical protein
MPHIVNGVSSQVRKRINGHGFYTVRTRRNGTVIEKEEATLEGAEVAKVARLAGVVLSSCSTAHTPGQNKKKLACPCMGWLAKKPLE